MAGRWPLLVVVGPTAAGKSELAVRLARELGGEVLGADSVQVYRGFDIGSGKLSLAERQGVRHHLIDVVEPGEPYSAARFVAEADAAIGGAAGRGHPVVVAGGTGLYVRALLRGLFQAPPPDPAIRERHQRWRCEQGVERMHAELARLDPKAAERIHPRDFVRVSRALEVLEQTGRPISEQQARHGFESHRYPALLVGLRPPRPVLRERIEERVDAMLSRGWLAEVEGLLAHGHGESRPMASLGYRQLRAVVEGGVDLAEAVRQTKRATWVFARRQLNWFSTEPGIEWYEDEHAVGAAARLWSRLERLPER